MKLEEHLKALETLEKLARSLASPDLTDTTLSDLKDAITRLRSLRAALLDDALRIVDAIEKGEIASGEEAEDLYALAGYYSEAAYHSEKRLLSMLKAYVDDSDYKSLELLRSVFSRVLSSLE